jgi:hypothetical protein
VNPLRWIAGLWSFSRRSWVDVGLGLRPRSGASALVLFLFLIFLIIGAILTLLGFDLVRVDAWLDDHSSWFDAVGSLMFRAICALVFLVCAALVASPLFTRTKADRIGWGGLIAALAIGYFAWFGMVGSS